MKPLAQIPESINAQESLGRSVFSSRHAKRARRTVAPPLHFLEKCRETDISVDRLDFASKEDMAEISEAVAAARDKNFYGWAVVATEIAEASGRQVSATPQPDNPYHADIKLPDCVMEDREAQKQHAQALADASRWREKPDFHT